MKIVPEYDLTRDTGRQIRRWRDYVIGMILTDAEGTPLNLTGCQVAAQIRSDYSTTADLVAEFTAIITDAVTGSVQLSLTDAQTGAIAHDQGVFDLLIRSAGGIDETWMEGKVQIVGSATRTPDYPG